MEERGKIDVIITLNDDNAQEKSRQMRAALGLRIDNAAIIDEKARIYKINKSKVLTEIPTNDYTVLKDYNKFPVIYVEVNENALKKLLHNPAVKIIGENNKSIPFLSESLPLIGASQANSAGATGAGTSVAVLDTGVNYTLNAFGSCTSPGAPSGCKVAYAHDFAPDDGLMDDNGHGTNVSGIVVGVAPDTKILGLDVFRSDGYAYDSDILSALGWVYSNVSTYHIQAVNMSFGGSEKYSAPCPTDNLASAITNLKSAGVLTVIASGNNVFTDGISRPACIPDAISVGAVYDSNVGYRSYSYPSNCVDGTTATDQVTCFSNSAYFLTMLAPGALITSAGSTMSGTSQAAPHVAGAIAAIRDVIPGFSVDGTYALLTSTGTPVTDGRNSIVKPRLDLAAACPSTCSNSVRIAGGSYYTSLQNAYNAAGNGDTIQTSKTIITGNLNANRNISITLRGGYDCNFVSSTGYTYVKGSIQRTSGILSLGNVILIR